MGEQAIWPPKRLFWPSENAGGLGECRERKRRFPTRSQENLTRMQCAGEHGSNVKRAE